MRFMGRRSRQVVCGERNGRTLFVPKIRKKIKNVEVQKKRGVRFLQNKKKFDERDVNFCELASRNFAAPLQKTPPFRGRSCIIFLF